MTWMQQEPAYFSTVVAVRHKYPKDTNLALPWSILSAWSQEVQSLLEGVEYVLLEAEKSWWIV